MCFSVPRSRGSISPKVIYACVKEENGRVVHCNYSTATGSVQDTLYSLFSLYCRASSVLGFGLDSGDLSGHLDYISKHPVWGGNHSLIVASLPMFSELRAS